jgi:hypothetical protein
MANPTTNYGFVLPTSTDLVTDLPADFDVALQGVDTRLKALQPGTTLGDLAYSSATANTNTRLGIGSTGNVLTVAGGVPTWAAPAGAPGANWSLLNSGGTDLTGAATITVSGISGKDSILVAISSASSANVSSAFQWRINGDTGSNYNSFQVDNTAAASYSPGLFSSDALLSQTSIYTGTMSNASGGASPVTAYMFISGANAAGVKAFWGVGGGKRGDGSATGHDQRFYGGVYTGSSTVSSVSILSSSGDFDAGKIWVYTTA